MALSIPLNYFSHIFAKRENGYALSRFIFLGSIAICCLVASCTQQPQQAQEIARVNNSVLTKKMITAQNDSTQILSATQQRLFAQRWITSELLYQEAKRVGLDQSEAVQKNIAEAQKQLVIAALLEREVFGESPSTLPTALVQTYFSSHREEFILPGTVMWISSVVFSERDAAAEFRSSVLDGKNWDVVLESYKANPALSNNIVSISDSLFYTETQLFPAELWKVATALGLFEVSFPVKTSAGYFVLRSLGHFKKGKTPPMRFVEATIRERLSMEQRQQRYAEFVEQLRKKNVVQLFLSEKDSLQQ